LCVRLGLSVNWGLSRVGPDNVRQGRTLSVWRFLFVDRFEKDLESLDLNIFSSSNTPLLIVWCSYTQEI
jgi:hypothetical protein